MKALAFHLVPYVSFYFPRFIERIGFLFRRGGRLSCLALRLILIFIEAFNLQFDKATMLSTHTPERMEDEV